MSRDKNPLRSLNGTINLSWHPYRRRHRRSRPISHRVFSVIRVEGTLRSVIHLVLGLQACSHKPAFPIPLLTGTRKTSVPYHVHKGCTDLRFFRQKPESQPHSIHGTGEMTGSLLSPSLLSNLGCDRSQSALGGLPNPNFGSLPQPVYPLGAAFFKLQAKTAGVAPGPRSTLAPAGMNPVGGSRGGPGANEGPALVTDLRAEGSLKVTKK
jgi:hypothetical protein